MLPVLTPSCRHGTHWTLELSCAIQLLLASRTVSKQGDGSQQRGIEPERFLRLVLLT